MERLILRGRKTRKDWWQSRTAAAADWSSFFPSGPGSSSGACFHRGLPPVPPSLVSVRLHEERESTLPSFEPGVDLCLLRAMNWWKWCYVFPAYLLRRLEVSASWLLEPWVRGPGCSAGERGQREEDWEADTRGRAPSWTPRPTHHPMQPRERPQVKTAQLSIVTYRNVWYVNTVWL